jgi:SrtB family sortase
MTKKTLTVIQIISLILIAVAAITSINRMSILNSLKLVQETLKIEDVILSNKSDVESYPEDPTEIYTTEGFSLTALKDHISSINTKELLAINKDYVGWLIIEGTKVDYPIVRGNDNSYYLKRTFNHRQSDLGAIFMDYRNLGQFLDDHTVIYGHYVKKGSMFGDLQKYLNVDFFNEHRTITLHGLYDSRTYLIISVYSVLADAYQIPLDQKPSLDYIRELVSLSVHTSDDIESYAQKEIKLLTLATCTPGLENGRLIIHALEWFD